MRPATCIAFVVLLVFLQTVPSLHPMSGRMRTNSDFTEADIPVSVCEPEEKELTEDQKVFISTIAGEATITAQGYSVSPLARQAIANVIMNRIGQREWARYTSAADICACTGFGGYKSYLFHACMDYLNHRDGSNEEIELLIEQVLPVYEGKVSDITGGAQLFYTPAAMPKGVKGPRWDSSKLKEVLISGVDPYYEGRFFRYK